MSSDSDLQLKSSTVSATKVDDEFRGSDDKGGDGGEVTVENRDVAIKTNLIKRSLESDHQSEKCDILPENFEKNSCDITPNDDESTSISGATTSSISLANNSSNNKNIQLNEVDTTLNSNNSNLLGDGKSCDNEGERNSKLNSGLAFTIDFNEGKTVDNKKYREIVERFQNRQQQQQQQRQHKRGVSLSKLDDTRKSSTSLNNVGRCSPCLNEASSSVASKPPLKQKNDTLKNSKVIDNRNNIDVDILKGNSERDDTIKVTLRSRPSAQKKMSLDCKEPSKRHSWSPRSSQSYEQQYAAIPSPAAQPRRQLNYAESKKAEATAEFQPKSATLQRALEARRSVGPSTVKRITKTYENNLVVTAPLEYVRNSDEEGSQGAVSDAGTYTLDGDNYTEEEKERMSIDRLAKKTSMARDAKPLSVNQDRSISQKLYNLRKQQQQEISLVSPQENENRVFYQETKSGDKFKMPPNTSHVSKVSYLDKIKSRVKTIGDRTFHKSKPSVEKSESSQQFRKNECSAAGGDSSRKDLGTFTSITACGVLNKNVSQEANKKGNGNRKNSLTKLQIDSSEYIQPKHNIDEKLLNSYTDYEKAKQCEYQLNIFSTVASYTSSSATPPHTDDDDIVTEEEPISIKTAPTKNDWIKEWAKNARRRNSLLTATNSAQGITVANANVKHKQNVGMSHSFDASYYNNNEFGDDVIEMIIYDDNKDIENVTRRSRSNCRKDFLPGESQKQGQSTILRPPISPTKIPSPVHSQLRARSSSVNQSFRNSNVCLDNIDTESYLEKTAAAISSLQKIHYKNNSPQSPLSPRQRSNVSDFSSSPLQNSYETAINIRPIHLHKRNLSLDVKAIKNEYLRSNFDIDANYGQNDEQFKKRHTRHNSLENKTILLSSPKRNNIDQTYLPGHQKTVYSEQQRLMMNKYVGANSPNGQVRRDSIGDGSGILSNGSPIRRSSSFCNKSNANIGGGGRILQQNINKKSNHRKSNMAPNALQKSISSSSFKQFMSSPLSVRNHNYNVNDNARYYINNEDFTPNDDYNLLYSSDDSEDNDINHMNTTNAVPEPPISHTRYNKAFLMRMEQNKQIATGSPGSMQPKGVAGCPNTPELPRRAVNTRSPYTSRASVPRDSSLSRMKQDLPNLVTTKKSLTQSLSKDSSNSTGSSLQQRVLPKYMDISKYKSNQGQNFLKRDESKSTLINRNEIRKSPSASGLCKTDTTRSSMRVKSAGAKPNTPAATKETKAREAELAMWRRRATYDPMKAAAEGKKKKEANKVAQKVNRYNDSGSVVLRSQSFHSGVSKINGHMREFDDGGCNRWTIVSTESSDEDEFGESS